MDYTEIIKKIFNHLFNQKIYFSNESGEIKNFLNKYKHIKSEKEILHYLEEDNAYAILGRFYIKKIKEVLSINGENKTIMQINGLLEDLSIKNLPSSFEKEIIIENNKPFDNFNYIAIDKKFIPNVDNFNELRKSIKPIEHFIYYILQNDLVIKDLKLICNYTSQIDKSYQNEKGSLFDNIITVNMYQLKNSIVYHEYFHALDIKINNKNNGNCLSDESEIFLENYEKYIKNIDKNSSTPEETKKDLHIYFNKHFSLNFKNKNLKEITKIDLEEEIKNFRLFSMNYNQTKVSELANELIEHINYVEYKIPQPKRKIFSIFSDMAGVTMHEKYFKSNAEKLARIYQSGFSSGNEFFYHHEPLIKQKLFLIIPEGSEAVKLFDELTEIIKNEFVTALKKSKKQQYKKLINCKL